MKHIKRRMLKELVEQNVYLIEGKLPLPLRRSGKIPKAAAGGLMGALGLLFTFYFAVNLSTEGVASRPRTEPLPLKVRGSDALKSLAAPSPMDPAALPLTVRKVTIDPGHGGFSAGTRASVGLIEKELTLDLALRLRELLEEESFEVVMTREADVAVSLEERAYFGNVIGADIFVSIHVNWFKDRRVRGVETYYLGPTEDPFITQLAAVENRESDLALADFRQLLDEIYFDFRNDYSKQLAGAVQKALYRSLRKINHGIRNRGVKKAPFVVLAKTKIPAILVEVSCLSNKKEAELLTQSDYRQRIAEALFSGIQAYADGLKEKGSDL